jgi:hypothetical protein
VNRVTTYLCVLLACFLAACAAPKVASLAPADRKDEIVVAQKLSVVEHSISGIRWEHVALPGTYVAERKDANGVFFFGPGRSIVVISELYKNQPHLKVGGIYLPNASSEPAQFFYVFETEVHTAADIDAYVQSRIVTTTSTPGLSTGGVGTTVAGNLIGGALVNAIIESGVGEVARVFTKSDPSLRAKLVAGLRQATESSGTQSSTSPQR